jgi:hypothetical protein
MAAPAPPRHVADISSILNNDTPEIILDETQLATLHGDLVAKTSGCSLEQLEQVNATLMDAIWKKRAEYNRNKVIHHVQDAFNEIIKDIEGMQKVLKSTQEELDAQKGYQPSQHPPSSQMPQDSQVGQAWSFVAPPQRGGYRGALAPGQQSQFVEEGFNTMQHSATQGL